MCKVRLFKNAYCRHKYFVLDIPCAKGRNLLTCPMFRHRSITYVPDNPPFKERYLAPRGSCPWCDFKGDYDMRYTRVAWKEKRAYKIGSGASPRDVGVEVPVPKALFCIVM